MHQYSDACNDMNSY